MVTILSCSKIIKKLHWLNDEQEGGRKLELMFNNAVKNFLIKKLPLLMVIEKNRAHILENWRDYWLYQNHHGHNSVDVNQLADAGAAAIGRFIDTVWTRPHDCVTGIKSTAPLGKNGLFITCTFDLLKQTLGTTLFSRRGTEVVYLTLAPIGGGRFATLPECIKLKLAVRFWAFRVRFGQDPIGLRVLSLTTGRSVAALPHEIDFHAHLFAPVFEALALARTQPGETPVPIDLPPWAKSHYSILRDAPPLKKAESLSVFWELHETGVERARSLRMRQLSLFETQS